MQRPYSGRGCTVPEQGKSGADNSIACTLRSCPTFDVRKYLYQLRQMLPCVRPVPIGTLKSLHIARDYKGMVRLIKKTMNVETDIHVLWVLEGAANTGSAKDAPAWVNIPSEMPPYGSKPFREMRLDIFLRRSFLETSAYDQIAITIAHELSHIVLESIKHPLRRCEKAVDLTAMLLGFRRLYGSGSQKEQRSGQGSAIQQLGYLSSHEVQLADQVIRQIQLSRMSELFDRIRAYLKTNWYPHFRMQEEQQGVAVLLGLCGALLALMMIAKWVTEHPSRTASANASIFPQPAQSTGTAYHGEESSTSSAAPTQKVSTTSGTPPSNQIVKIQTRLVELGYLDDRPDGVWGDRSRRALRAFKAANGLPVKDFWDEEASSVLFSLNAAYAPAPAVAHAKKFTR
jgi:hypothetical protein